MRLFCEPIPEIEALVDFTQTRNDAKQLVLQLPAIEITCDVATQRLRHTAVDDLGERVETTTPHKLAPRNGLVKLRLLVDRLSIHAFAFAGARFATHYDSPSAEMGKQSLRSTGGEAHITSLRIDRIKSA